MAKARFAYQVLEVKDSFWKGKQSGVKLGEVINEQAAVGWRLTDIIKEHVAGRAGGAAVSGVLLVFEYEYTDEDYAPAMRASDVVE